MIRVGPAGWSYDDWNGIVYPSNPSRNFDRLAWMANYFDVVEVNTSFYHIPPPRLSRSWARRVERPEFRFTAKLHRSFTHDQSFDRDSVRAFQAFLEPLVQEDRFGALLVQFPWSLRYGSEALERMNAIFSAFPEVPTAVEVRHASFDIPAFREFLGDRGISLVAVDQPPHRDALSDRADVTAEPAYVRLHGRNLQKWFQHDEAWERYDYLYSPDELDPWTDRVRAMPAEEIFVIMNNHFRGQAVVNALEMKRSLGLDIEVPPTLATRYPERFEPPAGSQGNLFPVPE